MNDPIADLFTRIRNAGLARQEFVIAPYSKFNNEICKILKKEGYIVNFEKSKKNRLECLRIIIKYIDNRPMIRSIRRISKPGRRIYSSREGLARILKGVGIAIISTTNGLMTAQEAQKQNLGGEIICEIT